jgi:hypothetical protein
LAAIADDSDNLEKPKRDLEKPKRNLEKPKHDLENLDLQNIDEIINELPDDSSVAEEDSKEEPVEEE